MAMPASVPLLDHFAALSDLRQHGKVLYPLPEISWCCPRRSPRRTTSFRRRCGERNGSALYLYTLPTWHIAAATCLGLPQRPRDCFIFLYSACAFQR